VVEDRWRGAAKTAGSSEVARIRRVDPELVEKETWLLGAALRRVADRLPDGGRALLVGHSPTNEAAVLGLTGTSSRRWARAPACSSAKPAGGSPSSR